MRHLTKQHFKARLAEVRGDLVEWDEVKGNIRTVSFIHGVVHGVLPNKSNSRRIVSIRTQKGMLTRVIKEKGAEEFVEKVVTVATRYRDAWRKPMEGALALCVSVTPVDMRRDLDCELLCDALQAAGLVKNDRAFWRKEYTRLPPDRDDPRVEFTIKEYQGATS